MAALFFALSVSRRTYKNAPARYNHILRPSCCRRCLRTYDECTYSYRRWHLLNHPYQQQQQEPQETDVGLVHPTQVVQRSTSGAVVDRGAVMLPLKRYHPYFLFWRLGVGVESLLYMHVRAGGPVQSKAGWAMTDCGSTDIDSFVRHQM